MHHKLIEDKSLRDRICVFRDRKEAGILLARKLSKYKGTDSFVFGIPSGGVPVAAEIAQSLALPLDLIIVRKIQIPYNTEAGFGAVGPDGRILLNEELLRMLSLSDEEVECQIQKTKEMIAIRNGLFRKNRPFPSVKNKIVIIADDGLASGYTMLSAIEYMRRQLPHILVVAVPTGLKKTIDLVLPQTDELVCLNVRSGHTFAVADAYKMWYDLDDNDVISILHTFEQLP